MLTGRFIGFFHIFRKGNIAADAPWAVVIFMALLQCGLLFSASAPALAAPFFYTDPQTGDRNFHTSPPDPSSSSSGSRPDYIFVAPEVYPGDNWQNGSNKPPRRSLGPPPGGYPPTYDRPPTGGGSFIPRDPAWPGASK
ncbi:MAG: hypothetical protein LBM64_05530 [Deltaproteobacteria bacterium]|jgi:hypothetical protein|nr:hypothetical protein [Deltaproteobacteria bacterium]